MGIFRRYFAGMKKHSELVNDYFGNAVRVYYLSGGEAARLAALTAAIVSAGNQRESQIAYLDALASDFRGIRFPKIIEERLLELKEEIRSNRESMVSLRRRLASVDPEYEEALGGLTTPDPGVFARRHPDLFEAEA